MGYLDHVEERFGLIRLAAYLRQALKRIVTRMGVRDKEHETAHRSAKTASREVQLEKTAANFAR